MFDRTPHRFIDVGHSQLAYRRYGAGPDVVLVHGWPLHSATYRHLLPGLAARFTCHLFDLPGAGDTVFTDDTRFDLRSQARTLSRAIDAVGIERCALVGHDSGGAVARFVAAERPERATGVVLGNTEIPGHVSFWVKLVINSGKSRIGRAVLRRALAWRRFRHSGLGFGGCFDDRRLIDGEFHTLFVAPLLADRAVSDAQTRLPAEFDWRQLDELADAHAAITAPVLLIWGADDRYFTLASARELAARHGWALEELRPGKLFVHEERPDDFARLTADFLARAAPAARERRQAR